jgi:hypothetical protein
MSRMNCCETAAILLALWAVELMRPATVSAQPTEQSQTYGTANRKANLEPFLKDAQTYEMTLLARAPVRLELMPNPVMNWDGSAFIWLKDGRPEIIGAFWTNLEPRTARVRHPHAFHSLSEYPIEARFGKHLVWNPKKPGLQFKPIEGAEAPDDKSWRRLTQMRALAREFSVTGVYGRLEDTSRRQLRLLTQPIFRYEPTAGIVQDGAIFAFTHDVLGTDPDALVVIEARQADGKPRWEYSFARFHFTELTGHHQENQVWKVENEWPEPRRHVFGADPGRGKIYYSVERP